MEQVFEPDGWDARLRVGLLVPDGDIGPESEWSAMAPPGVAVNASRFRFPVGAVEADADRIAISPVEYVAAPGPLDEALELLNPPSIDVYSLAFTSTSYVGDDADLVARLSELAGGRPVVTTGQALLAAVAHFDAANVLLVDPPWFPGELTDLGRQWLERNGVVVARAEPAGLPSGQGNIHPGAMHRWLCRAIEGIDLVLVGGNGFRAVGAVNAVEEDTGVAVVTANTALLWHTLRAAGRPTAGVTRYGKIFAG
ncbi:MAG: maleate cis-trans isomerase [Acidimicrobiia bacterium]|nr:maleate cis-trans isomerase [Acidimicrobiia bacterium]